MNNGTIKTGILNKKSILYLIAVLGLVALALIRPFEKRAIANSDSNGTNIICFGDSLTTGNNVAPNESYPSVLSTLLGTPVINAGEDGDTTQTALARLEHDVLAKDPLLVIVILGGNDFLQQRPKQETMENIRAIVRKIREKGAMVALGQIGPFTMLGYRGDYQKIAMQEKAVLIKDALAGIFGNPQLMSDQIHPNAKGYAKLAHKVFGEIKPLLEMNQSARRNR